MKSGKRDFLRLFVERDSTKYSLRIILSILIVVGLQGCDNITGPTTVEPRECGPDEGVELRGLYNDEDISVTAPCGVTIDSSEDIVEVMETPLLQYACDRYWSYIDPETGRLPDALEGEVEPLVQLLLCGKHMFMRGGVPLKGISLFAGAMDMMSQNFPGEAGVQFSKLGMLPIPGERYPAGMVVDPYSPQIPIIGRRMMFTCSGCHMNKLDDGRFVVGAANNDLHMGKLFALVNYMLYKADSEREDRDKWPQELVDYYDFLDGELSASKAWSKPVIQIFDKMPKGFRDIVMSLAPWASAAEYRSFVKARPGTFNVYSPMMSFTDREFYMSTPHIYSVRKYEDEVLAGLDAPAANVAKNFSVEELVEVGFYLTFQSSEYVHPKYVNPLSSYVRILKSPKNPNAIYEGLAEEGEYLFNDHCAGCHDGPRGESLSSYPLSLMGTPRNLEEAFADYDPPSELSAKNFEYLSENFYSYSVPSSEIHARPLLGVWNRKALMLNGTIKNLDHAFCLTEGRGPVDRDDPLTDGVHLDLCSDYSLDEKFALVEFLKSWD